MTGNVGNGNSWMCARLPSLCNRRTCLKKPTFGVEYIGVGIFCVNPRLKPRSARWYLRLLRKFQPLRSGHLCLTAQIRQHSVSKSWTFHGKMDISSIYIYGKNVRHLAMPPAMLHWGPGQEFRRSLVWIPDTGRTCAKPQPFQRMTGIMRLTTVFSG